MLRRMLFWGLALGFICAVASQGYAQSEPSKSGSSSSSSQSDEPKSSEPKSSEPKASEPKNSSSKDDPGAKDVPLIWTTHETPSGRKVMVLQPKSEAPEDQPASGGASSSSPGAGSATTSEATPSTGGGTTGTAGSPAAPDERPPAADDSPTMIVNDQPPESLFPEPSTTEGTSNTVLTAEEVASIESTLSVPVDASPSSSDRRASGSGVLPRVSSVGAYGGYPSTVGFHFAAPTDGPIAFRSGLTGLPGVGILWTPGVELRFGQDWETYSTDSAYAFTNLYLGKEVRNGPDKEHKGLEAGLGYRWLLPDRRGVRWIAGFEIGGRWTDESAFPDVPSFRAFWMIAAP